MPSEATCSRGGLWIAERKVPELPTRAGGAGDRTAVVHKSPADPDLDAQMQHRSRCSGAAVTCLHNIGEGRVAADQRRE